MRLTAFAILLVLMVAVACRADEGTSTGGASAAARPDERLDHGVTYQAAARRLHAVVSDLSRSSGVTIYCGAGEKDWKVRDLPVTVCATDIPLRKLLRAITFATHTIIRSTKTDRGMVYRIIEDPSIRVAVEKYEKDLREAQLNELRWAWNAASKLKDVPLSMISRWQDPPAGWDEQALVIKETSALIDALGTDALKRVMSGETVELTPRMLAPALRQRALNVLKARDAQYCSVSRTYAGSQFGGVNESREADPALPDELDNSLIRISLRGDSQAPDIHVRPVIATAEGPRNQFPIHEGMQPEWDCTLGEIRILYMQAEPKIAEQAGKPYSPEWRPSPQMPQHPDKSGLKSVEGLSSAQKTYKLPERPAESQSIYAEALAGISRASGFAIVCEDFHVQIMAGDDGAAGVFGAELTVSEALRRADPFFSWYCDDEETILVGHVENWIRYHKDLIPASILDGLRAKAGGDGVRLDDITQLAQFTQEQVWQWSSSVGKGFSPQFGSTSDRPLWAFYDSLPAEQKALAKSDAGLHLAPFATAFQAALQERRKQRSDALSETQPDPCDVLADPDIAPTLVMRIRESAGISGKHDCVMVIDGRKDGEKVSAEFGGQTNLPYYTPERENELRASP